MQSTVSVLMAAIVFIVEFFSGILSSASDREPAKPKCQFYFLLSLRLYLLLCRYVHLYLVLFQMQISMVLQLFFLLLLVFLMLFFL